MRITTRERVQHVAHTKANRFVIIREPNTYREMCQRIYFVYRDILWSHRHPIPRYNQQYWRRYTQAVCEAYSEAAYHSLNITPNSRFCALRYIPMAQQMNETRLSNA